jgi:phosphotransferase system enzyme I (PtsI)
MVETPAAAIGVDAFVQDVSFLSIGTNDLVQYTLAVDRGNASLVTRFTPLHPAVLRLIARTADVGQAAGLDVSVCGEMASQPLMAYALLGLGVRQLSVSAVGLPAVKRIIRGVSTIAAERTARLALDAPTARDAARILRKGLVDEIGEDLLDGLLGLGEA